MASVLTTFVDGVKRVCDTHIVSVVLFGSRAHGESADAHADYNILIILDAVSMTELDALSVLVDKWVKAGNNAPLVFTQDEFRRSVDVFPIEFLDMQSHHKVLVGNDPFAGIAIDDRHLRHECEYELRSKLQKLRRAYLMAGGNKQALRALLGSSISSFIVMFRYALRLAGATEVPTDKYQTITQASLRFGITAATFESALKVRRDELELSSVELSDMIARYMLDIEKVIAVIDTIQ